MSHGLEITGPHSYANQPLTWKCCQVRKMQHLTQHSHSVLCWYSSALAYLFHLGGGRQDKGADMTAWSCVKVQIQPRILCCCSLLAALARPHLYRPLLRSSSGSHFHTSLSPLRNWWPFHPPHSFAASAKWNRGHRRRPSLKDTVTSQCSAGGKKESAAYAQLSF